MSHTPCTRCGDCCTAYPCGIGMSFFGGVRPCPALEGDKVKSCAFLVHPETILPMNGDPEHLIEIFKDYLGVGMGCCNSRQQEGIFAAMREFYKEMKRLDEASPDATEEDIAFRDSLVKSVEGVVRQCQ